MYTNSFFDTIKGQEFVDAVISLTKKIDVKKCENCNNIDALTREKIFREVERQYLIADAKSHYIEYLQSEDEDDDDTVIAMAEEKYGNDIWDKIVARFEKTKDCNIAENITWEDAVKNVLSTI